ncbi:hypothetical protein RJT34_27534 [Clitoria ternatea]|uniref:Secreted protein n=1 Tax=Clitoria ternatea TaxID=43366 RepID=A0AAN9FA29_CLITE
MLETLKLFFSLSSLVLMLCLQLRTTSCLLLLPVKISSAHILDSPLPPSRLGFLCDTLFEAVVSPSSSNNKGFKGLMISWSEFPSPTVIVSA